MKFIFLGIFLISCSHPQTPGVLTPKLGDNALLVANEISNLRIIKNGSALLYTSSERPQHRQPQLYTLDLSTKKEFRVTHNDGEVIAAEEHPDGTQIIYSSSTDEIKEKTQMDFWAEKRTFVKKDLNYQIPSELYISRSDGSDIRRITKSPGFDSDFTVNRFGRYILFTSTREGYRGIYRTSLSGGATWRVSEDKKDAFSPRLSPDSKKLIWLQTQDQKMELRLASPDMHKQQVLANFTHRPSGMKWDPTGTKLLFAARSQGSDHAQIWELDVHEQCIQLLLDESGLEGADPALSPDSKQLYYLKKSPTGVSISITEPKGTGDCSKTVMF